MNKKSVAAVAAALGMAVGIGGSVITYSVAGGDETSSNTALISDTISSYVTAINDADTDRIGKMSCGQLEKDFKSATPESISAQLKAATKERGRAKIDRISNISIEDGKAMAAAMVTFDKNGKSQANLTTYGLREINSQWKVCWNVNVNTVNAESK